MHLGYREVIKVPAAAHLPLGAAVSQPSHTLVGAQLLAGKLQSFVDSGLLLLEGNFTVSGAEIFRNS